jgi:hypothetical protein
MDLNPNDKLLLKKIVTQLARSVRDIQQRLYQQGMASRDGVWLIGDLKRTIEVDILKNPSLPDLIDKVKTGDQPLENLTSTEKYAKNLSDMVTPVKEERQRRRRKTTNGDPEAVAVDKELREYFGIKLPMHEHMVKVREHWSKAKSEDWAYRYRWVYAGLYKLLPKWKRDVVDKEPEDRISNELAREVASTAQDFDLYDKLVQTLPDDSEIKAELSNQLLSTSYERMKK